MVTISLSIATYISLPIIGLTALYYYFNRNSNYWRSRGVKSAKQMLFIVVLYKMFRKGIHVFVEENRKIYGKLYGGFFGSKPGLIVGEPDLIKDILVKDFHIFTDRNDMVLDDPYLERSIFFLRDPQEWKKLRSVISPTFSSGKMRKMFYLVEECVKSAEKVLINVTSNGSNNEIDMKTFLGNYTMDVIASCAFATKIDTHNDPNNPFIKNATKLFKPSLFSLVCLLSPKLSKLLGITFGSSPPVIFFKKAINSIIERRSSGNEKHHDFLQLIIDAQNNSNINENEDQCNDCSEAINRNRNESVLPPVIKTKINLTEVDILANAFLFLNAGYDTTASTLSFLFYSLAINPECQQKLLEEIMSHQNSEGIIDYDTMARMPYLDACINETLRRYPPVTIITRVASEDYALGNTGITIEKGITANIDVYGTHHDPDYYPNPYNFDPERFMPSNRDKLIPYSFLPFGAGPRNCVGMRFAFMQMKAIIVSLLPKFGFVKSANTKIPIQFKKLAFNLQPSDVRIGIQLRN